MLYKCNVHIGMCTNMKCSSCTDDSQSRQMNHKILYIYAFLNIYSFKLNHLFANHYMLKIAQTD